MRLYLVRHGESVDNVAGLYAGSRDSPLTAHGVLQARRLATHLVARGGPVRYVFASDLQRAYDTAQAIVDAQVAADAGQGLGGPQVPLAVVKLADLRERNFGSLEGVKYGSRSVSGPSGGANAHWDAETRVEMQVRVDRFIDLHLVPLLRDLGPLLDTAAGSVVVVAHGIILNVLLRSLLSRFAPTELARLVGGSTDHIASWSNTGFLEADIHPAARDPSTEPCIMDAKASGPCTSVTSMVGQAEPVIRLTVTAVNCVEHLRGLKKTRGGIGSAKFDSKQKTMDSFFKPASKGPA